MLPVFTLVFFIYNWGMNNVRTDISKSMSAQVTFYMYTLEKDMQRTQALQYDCITDRDLNLLAATNSMSEFDIIQSLLRLQNRLVSISGSNMYINDVCAYIPKINKKVSAKYGVDQAKQDEMDKFVYPAGLTGQELFLYQDGKLYMDVIYPPQNSYIGKPPLFCIVVEFSLKSFFDALQQFNFETQGGTILYDTRGRIIAEADKDSIVLNGRQQIMQQENNPENIYSKPLNIQGKDMFCIYYNSKYLGMTLVQAVPEELLFSPAKMYQLWVILFAVVAFGIMILFLIYMNSSIRKPLTKMVKSFRKVEEGDLSISIEHRNDDEFKYLYSRFNIMVNNLNVLFEQVYKQKILAQNAELKQLQTQINPHFLYNSFFLLDTMIQMEEYANARRFTRQLGEYFQYITRNSAEFVPLRNEIKHAQIYCEIQAARYIGRIEIRFGEFPDSYRDVTVPRLILQPILENSFEHGLRNVLEDGLLTVSFETANDVLLIAIQDNGEGMEDGQFDELMRKLVGQDGDVIEMTGVLNINRRLQLHLGPESGIDIARMDGGGTRVTVKIPIKGRQ
jgi:two-component system sensor histidine kinase YesM